MLNSLNVNFVDCRPNMNGQTSDDRMGNLLLVIIPFKELNKEPLSFEEKNSKLTYKLLKVPACDENNFFSKACASG